MKIGLIVECGPEGPDEKVCRHFLSRLNESIEVECATMDSKRYLVENCGNAAAALLESDCEYVVIVWDMKPPWDSEAGTCLKAERAAVFRSIENAGVQRQQVRLVAIRVMLEAWLLSDERAIKRVIERPSHKLKSKRVKDPEQQSDPKARLKKIFEGYGGTRHTYSDIVHAIKLAEEMPDWKRVGKCASFKRFAEKAAGVVL